MKWLGTCVCGLLVLGCVSSAPLHPDAVRHNERGARSMAQGRLEDAEARFELALEYDRRFSEPWANLGAIALLRGEYALAETHLRRSIDLNPDFAEAWSNLGVVHARKGERRRAVEAFEKALSIQPGLAAPRKNLGSALIRLDRFARARTHLRRLVQISPEDVVAQSLLAYTDLRLNESDLALKRVQRLLSRGEEEVIAYVVRGTVWAHRGDYNEAISDLEKGVSDAFVGVSARRRLAAVYAQVGRVTDARRLAHGLLRRDAGDLAAHLVLGWIELGDEEIARAKRHALAVLNAQPEHPEARLLLRQACKSAKSYATHPRCRSTSTE